MFSFKRVHGVGIRTESLWTERTSFFLTESLSLWLPLWGKWNSTRLISPWPWLECQNIIKEKGKTHGNMYQVHFSNSSWFLNELGPCLASATCGQAFPGLCMSSQKQTSKCLNGKGTETSAVWARCSANTDSAWVIVWDGEERKTRSHCKHSQLFRVRLVRVCACACVHALVPVQNCGQIQIWGHTLSQCSLFNFHRYVNSNAKACIWCIRKVYPKGEES